MGGAKKHVYVNSGGSVASMGSVGSMGSTQPGFSFGGKGVQRSSNPMEPKEDQPGPGQYDGATAIGKQVESHKATIAEPSFPVSTRDDSAKVFSGLDSVEFVDSPGPGTYLELNAEDPSVTTSPKWSFSGKGSAGGKPRERFPDEPERAPGPGAYQSKTGMTIAHTTAGKCTFGSSDRKSFNPTTTPSLGGYIGADSLRISDMIQRPASPSFSFGGSPSPIKSRKGKVGKRVSKSPASSSRPATSAGERESSKKSYAPLVAKRNNYDWIYGNEPGRGRSSGGYKKTLDGADMPRSSPFKKQAQYTFGKDGRFSDKIYMAHKPKASRGQTPGPIYDIGSTIGTDLKKFKGKSKNGKGRGMMKGFSFPGSSSDRTNPETRQKILEDQPGPGHYNIRLEHQVEARLQEADELAASMHGEYEGGPEGESAFDEGSLDASLTTMGNSVVTRGTRQTNATGRSQMSMLSTRSHQSIASDLGIKFGDMCMQDTAPSFSFGTSDRDQRAKLFDAGDLNKEYAGKNSPGPCTAIPDAPNGRPKSPEWSFGGKNGKRSLVMPQSSDLGPAAFGQIDAVGKQLASGHKTAPDPKFGTAGRDAVEKIFFQGVSYAPKDVPGPIYLSPSDPGLSGLGKQVSSKKKSSSSFGFGSSTRNQTARLYMPGMTV